MSDQTFPHPGPERDEDGFGDFARTVEEAEVAAVNLDQPDSTDDVPWSPPEKAPIHAEFGEEREEETIDQRIAQEEPEEGTAYGAPEPGGVLGGADETSDDDDMADVVDASGQPDQELADAARLARDEDPYEEVEVDVLDDQA